MAGGAELYSGDKVKCCEGGCQEDINPTAEMICGNCGRWFCPDHLVAYIELEESELYIELPFLCLACLNDAED